MPHSEDSLPAGDPGGAEDRFLLPARLSRRGSQLLHAQCWAWGQDVKHPDGNLLLRRGFERLRPPAYVTGCSQYTLQAKDMLIRLWGFGIYIGREQGIYLNRFDFLPRRAVLADQWTPAALARGQRDCDVGLLCAFLEWASAYEVWVEQTAGIRYRHTVLRSFSQSDGALPDLALEWMCLRDTLDQVIYAKTASPTV